MNAYDAVLYVHLLSLFVALGAATVMTVSAFQLRAARTLADALPWARLMRSTPRAFPVAVLGLFGTGAYMTSDAWTWSTGWIDASIAGLAVVALQGPLVGGRSGAAIGRALVENGPGELGEPARRAIDGAAHWLVTLTGPALVLGVVWDMTEQPATGTAVAALVVAYAVGAAAGLRLAKTPTLAAESAAKPSC